MAPEAAEVRVVVDVGEGGMIQQLTEGAKGTTGRFAGATQRAGGGAAAQMKKGAGMVSTGLKKAGVQFGLASILKQSQIFTGFFGSLFQIIGGMVDVLLAPLMPILMPVLQWLAKQIPTVAKMAQAFLGPIVDWVLNIGKTFSQEGFLDGLKNMFSLESINTFFQTIGKHVVPGGQAIALALGFMDGEWWTKTARPNMLAWFQSVEGWSEKARHWIDAALTGFWNSWIVNPINEIIKLIYKGIDALPGDQSGWVVPQLAHARTSKEIQASIATAGQEAYTATGGAGNIPFSISLYGIDEGARIAIEDQRGANISSTVASQINAVRG